MSPPDDRDKFLDELVNNLRNDRPYIDKPDEVPIDLGGVCFLDGSRVCGASCTAFVDPDGPTARDRCAVLTGMANGLALLGELVQLGRRQARPVVEHRAPPDPMAQKKRPA